MILKLLTVEKIVSCSDLEFKCKSLSIYLFARLLNETLKVIQLDLLPCSDPIIFITEHKTQSDHKKRIATGSMLKSLPLQITSVRSWRHALGTQTSFPHRRSVSRRARRTSQPKSAHTRSGVPPTTGKPPATPPSSADRHKETEPVLRANTPDEHRPRAVSQGKLPPNYNATARRLVNLKTSLTTFFK